MFQTFPVLPFNKIIKISFILLFLSSVSYSQYAKPATYKILNISVQGNKSADVNTIIANSGLKIGDEIQIPGDKEMKAIHQLWNLGIFSDIKIVIAKQINNGVFLRIEVQEYPRFEKAVIEGNDELSTSKINEKIDLMRGQTLKPQDVDRIKQEILALYEKDGYLNAEINIYHFIYYTADTTKDYIDVTWRNKKDFSDEYHIKYNKTDIPYSDLIARLKNRVVLIFKIKENSKVVVKKIEFIGNKAFTGSKLMSQMNNTEEAKWWKFWSSAKFNPKKFAKDKISIINFYRKHGYRDAEILSDSLIYYNHKKDLKILIKVYEGPKYYVRNINWDGNTKFTSKELNNRLGFKKGDVYNYEKFEQNLKGNKTQSDVSSLYLDNGYLMFSAIPTEVKVGKDSIDINIRINEKSQFKVGRVNIKGNDKTEGKVIRRELYTIPGDYFNRGLLLRSVQGLANLKYFNVQKLYGPEGINYSLKNDSVVNVTFSVSEKSSDYLNASVGYSGSFGFSGAMGVTLSNFALDHPFSLGGGQILSFNWQFGVGSLYRTFSLGFTEPWLFNTPTLVGFQVFDTRQQYIYDLKQTGGTIRVGRRLKWPDNFFNVLGFFRFQYNDVLYGANYYPVGTSQQYTLGGTITRRDIDNPIFPSKGSTVSFSAQISGGPFLPGNINFYKLGFTARWYNRLFNSTKFTLYTAAKIGYMQELDNQSKLRIPYTEYYYMGGNGLIIATEPLRGYDDRSVGPRNINGQVVGGRVMEHFTTEIRFAVTLEPMPLYLLAFAEAGNVFLDLKHTDPFNLRRSAGVGVRIFINPVGLIGFDIGYGFDRMAVDGKPPKWLFHFQFGKRF